LHLLDIDERVIFADRRRGLVQGVFADIGDVDMDLLDAGTWSSYPNTTAKPSQT
jgi:hypothetical protein